MPRKIIFKKQPDKEIQKNINDGLVKATLYAHQKETLDYGIKNPHFILGDGQGLGKTIQIIGLAMKRKRLYNDKHCLIIVCVNGLKYNWKEEIEKFTDEKAYILGTRLKKNGEERIGGNAEKFEDISDLNKLPKEYFWIINIEAIRYKQGAGRGKYVIANRLAELCNLGIINMVAIDEIHKANNPNSKQTRALLKIQAAEMIAATGTLITNNPMDAYVPLKWLGFYDQNFYTFKDYYCVMGGFGGFEVIAYRHLDELNHLVNEHMLRRTKDQVLDLPPKIRRTEYVELSPQEKIYYKDVLNQTEKKVREIQDEMSKKIRYNEEKMILNQFAYLRQVTGNANILYPDFNESTKTHRCIELVDEYVSNGEKVVIFSNWTSITDRLYESLKKYNPGLITGKIDTEQRQKEVHRFQNDPECKIMIGTDGAMGTGLTLTAATNVIFMDSPWTKALKEQCEDRCHRIGTKGTVNVVTLVCKNTIDEYVERILAVKNELTDLVISPDRESDGIYVMMNWLKEKVKLL